MTENFSREQLADCLDEVKAFCSSPALDAVPWMNLKHPIHPVQDELIRSDSSVDKTSAENSFSAWVRAAWGFLYASWISFRILRVRLAFRVVLKELKGRSYEVVAKSWHFGARRTPEGDFYYGDLQARLSQNGVRMLLLTGDAQGALWDWTPDLKEKTLSSNRFPEWALVPLTAPWRVARMQWRVWRQLQRLAGQTDRSLLRRVAFRASRDLLSHRLIPTGLYTWVGREATRLWKPRAWLTLYEGHGWEQCLWRGVREANPACKIAGYQHTILPPHLLALLRPSRYPASRLRPDLVLCLGPRSKRLLQTSHPSSLLTVFGTFRRPKEGLQPAQGPMPSHRTVIVLPEGLPEEARFLFEAACKAARQSPYLKFIFRCHPQLPFEQIRSLLSRDPGDLPNVEISRVVPIERDFARSSVVLYRGSSSVLYAVLAGLKPIYLHQKGLREIDPLGEMSVWRDRILSWLEIEPRLKDFEQSKPEQIREEWRQAVQYVQEYTVGVSEDSVRDFLDLLGYTRPIRGTNELATVG